MGGVPSTTTCGFYSSTPAAPQPCRQVPLLACNPYSWRLLTEHRSGGLGSCCYLCSWLPRHPVRAAWRHFLFQASRHEALPQQQLQEAARLRQRNEKGRTSVAAVTVAPQSSEGDMKLLGGIPLCRCEWTLLTPDPPGDFIMARQRKVHSRSATNSSGSIHVCMCTKVGLTSC